MDNQSRRLQSKIDRAYDNAYRLREGRRARYWFRTAIKLDRKLHGPTTHLHFVDMHFSTAEAKDANVQDHLQQLLKLANATYGVPQKFMAINLDFDPTQQRYDLAVVVNDKV